MEAALIRNFLLATIAILSPVGTIPNRGGGDSLRPVQA